MTTIDEFARGPWYVEYGAQPEMDPLTDEDALVEAQVLEIRIDALRSRVAVLFDLRLALQLREGNTGLLVASEVTEFTWHAENPDMSRTAWNVVSHVPRTANGIIELKLEMHPDAAILLRACSAAFYSGSVSHVVEIPDYGTASESDMTSMIAQWGSEFVPVHAVFLNSVPPASAG